MLQVGVVVAAASLAYQLIDLLTLGRHCALATLLGGQLITPPA